MWSLRSLCASPAGSGDIVDQNLKLILGLIWTLILHYQISMGFGIGDDKGQNGPSPKQALIAYLQVFEIIITTLDARALGLVGAGKLPLCTLVM